MDRYSRELTKRKILYRNAYTAIAIISALVAPYWITAILCFVGVIYFIEYFEALIPIVYVDLTYGFPGRGLLGLQMGATFFYFVLILFFEYVIKPRISYYSVEGQ